MLTIERISPSFDTLRLQAADLLGQLALAGKRGLAAAVTLGLGITAAGCAQTQVEPGPATTPSAAASSESPTPVSSPSVSPTQATTPAETTTTPTEPTETPTSSESPSEIDGMLYRPTSDQLRLFKKIKKMDAKEYVKTTKNQRVNYLQHLVYEYDQLPADEQDPAWPEMRKTLRTRSGVPWQAWWVTNGEKMFDNYMWTMRFATFLPPKDAMRVLMTLDIDNIAYYEHLNFMKLNGATLMPEDGGNSLEDAMLRLHKGKPFFRDYELVNEQRFLCVHFDPESTSEMGMGGAYTVLTVKPKGSDRSKMFTLALEMMDVETSPNETGEAILTDKEWELAPVSIIGFAGASLDPSDITTFRPYPNLSKKISVRIEPNEDGIYDCAKAK